LSAIRRCESGPRPGARRDKKQGQREDKDQQEQAQRHKRKAIGLAMALAASTAGIPEDARIRRHQQVGLGHINRTP